MWFVLSQPTPKNIRNSKKKKQKKQHKSSSNKLVYLNDELAEKNAR